MATLTVVGWITRTFYLNTNDMSKTIEEAARAYAEDVERGLSFHHSSPNEVAQETEFAFLAGAEQMKKYIFQLYDESGDMDFVKWKLNQEENE